MRYSRHKIAAFSFAICAAIVSAGALQGNRVPTFSKDVAPLIYSKCAPCHYANGPTPFSLSSYEDASKRARQLARDVVLRFMPPCRATSDFGEFCIVGELSEEEITTLYMWAMNGAPIGNASEAPPAPERSDEWPLGKPDAVLIPVTAEAVPADGEPFWRGYVLSLERYAGRKIAGYSFRPKSPSAIRHAYFALDSSQKPGEVFETGGSLMLTGEKYLGAWAVGYPPAKFVPGVARTIGRDERLIVQAQYHPVGKVQSGAYEVALYFAKSEHTIEPQWSTLSAEKDIIPAGERLQISSSMVMPLDAKLLSIIPEARTFATRIYVTAQMPGGLKHIFRTETWDPNWRGSYRFSNPPSIPKGTRITATIEYDNTNHAVINRNRKSGPVKFGPGAKDEIFRVHLEWVPE